MFARLRTTSLSKAVTQEGLEQVEGKLAALQTPCDPLHTELSVYVLQGGKNTLNWQICCIYYLQLVNVKPGLVFSTTIYAVKINVN